MFVSDTRRRESHSFKFSLLLSLLALAATGTTPLYAVEQKTEPRNSSYTQLANDPAINETDLYRRENELIEKQKAKLAESPVRDLSYYPKIMNYLKNHKVYISLTSSPTRFSKLQHVFSTLDLTYVHEILVNLPMNYSRNNETYNEETIQLLAQTPKVKVIRIEKDLGPITKLIPGLEYAATQDPESIVITIDDDIGYGKGVINELIYQTLISGQASVASSGQNIDFWKILRPFPKVEHLSSPHQVESVYKYFNKLFTSLYPHWVIDQSHSVDIVEGFGSIAYIVKNVNTELLRKFADVDVMNKVAGLEQKKSIRSCFVSDDVVISFTLALSGIDRKVIRNGYLDLDREKETILIPFEYGLGTDALHFGAGSDSGISSVDINEQKYQACYDLLMKISYDPEQKQFRTPAEILKFITDLDRNESI